MNVTAPSPATRLALARAPTACCGSDADVANEGGPTGQKPVPSGYAEPVMTRGLLLRSRDEALEAQ